MSLAYTVQGPIELANFFYMTTVSHGLNPFIPTTVIRVLSAKKLSEMDAPDDREYIKDELRFALNEHLGDSEEILQIYFTTFIVQ